MDEHKEPAKVNTVPIEDERKHQSYIDSLQQQVEYLKATSPEKYKKYQAIGDSLMACTYEPVSGDDDEGDKIKALTLLNTVKDYNIEDDLSETELNLLVKVYGVNWRKLLE